MDANSDELADLLYEASREGREEEVLELLKRGAPPNSSYYDRVHSGRTPLHRVCRVFYQHPRVAEHLIRWGAQIDAVDKHNQTPMHLACGYGNIECMQVLLKNHCRLDIKNMSRSETPIDLIMKTDKPIRTTAMRDLVLNYQFAPRGPLSGFTSVQKLRQLTVKNWYKMGENLGVSKDKLNSVMNDKHRTAAALFIAKTNNPDLKWKDVVEGLLIVGEYQTAARLCRQEALDGHTPLTISAFYGWVDLLEYLIENEGLDRKEPINEAGDSLLSLACLKGHIGVIDYLLKVKGFDMEGKVNASGDTLRSLAVSNGMSDVIEYLDNFNADPSDRAVLMKKYLGKLNELMRDRTNTTWLRYLKMYFIGASGLGKTTTRNRLTGMIRNLSSLPPEERKRCSTFLAECTQVLAIVDDSEAKLVLKAADDLDDEARMLFAYLYGSKSSDTDVADAQDPDATDNTPTTLSTEPNDEQLPHANNDATPTSGNPSEAPKQEDQTPPQHSEDNSQAKEKDDGEQVKQKPVRVTTVDIEQVVARLRSIVGSGKYADQLLGKILLNLVDVGGQPGFLEMLPFLSKGPGMFLAFFPLDKDLDEHCEVSYEREGDEITPYKATYTIRETLSQILSAISHHASFDSDISKEIGKKLGGLGSVKPVATLVGTFMDNLVTQVKAKILKGELSTEFPKATEEEMEAVLQHLLPPDTSAMQQKNDAPSAKQQSGNAPPDPPAEQQSSPGPSPKLQCSAPEKQSSTLPTTKGQDLSTQDVPKPSEELLLAVDKLLSSESFQAKVKKHLEQALKDKKMAIRSLSVNYKDLLNHPAGQEFFPVDNLNGTESDLDSLREHLQVVFNSVFKEAKLRIRPSQLLLGVVLRKEFDIASMEDAIQVGRALNMGEEEVRFTIWYLDYGVGALIYHPEIEDEDDWFVLNIICSPQVVFDSISTLITESLLELHSDGHCSRFNEEERENWKYRGQFSLETVKRCHSERNEKKVREGKLIPVEKLVKLLEHSNLLAQVIVKKVKGGKVIIQTMCFIPAILECATPEELTKSPPPDIDTPASVKITFEPRYVPIGVFCATISRLVSKGKEGILGMSWELVDSRVKRNLVTFRVDAAEHIVTLVAHVDSIEIRVIRQDRAISTHHLSSYVLSTVIFIIKQINRLVCPIVAFDCQCGRHQSRHGDKLCLLSPGVTPCFKCKRRKVSLTPEQERWFANEVKPNSSVLLKALQYAKEIDPSLSFRWLKDGSIQGTGNELRVEKVTDDLCEGYYTCEILKNGQPYFNVYHCLKATGEPEISENDQLLDEVREALKEVRAEWYTLAVELDIAHGTRKAIEKDYRFVEVCFHVMLQYWIKRTSPLPTWAALVRALKSPAVSREDIADELELEQDITDDDDDDSAGSTPQSTSDPLNVDKHLKMVRTAIWEVRANWKDLAVQLNIHEGTRKEIEHNYRDVAGACFTAMLEEWFTQTSSPATLGVLIEALKSTTVDREDIAGEIEAML